MTDDVFRYSPQIDKDVPKAVEESLKVKVHSIQKLTHGEVNHVYKVETENGTVVIRIFRRKYWPDIRRVRSIEKLLEQVSGIHPKTLFLTDEANIFPNGFMITQFIEGKNGQDAIDTKDISPSTFHRKLFHTLKTVHSVTVQGFGHLNPEHEVYDDFLSFRLGQLDDRFTDLQSIPEFDEVYKGQIADVLKELIVPLNNRIKPVLVHGDPTSINTIYTKDEKEIVLIDWDNASANTFMRDIAWLTYWIRIYGEKAESDALWASFKEVYTDTEFTDEELRILERVNHIAISLDNLPYTYFDKKDFDEYTLIKKCLSELVEGE